MDVNAKLDKIRHAIGRAQMFQGMGSTGANYVWALERAADAFMVLDAHLSAGGTPPEEWREGPDAADEAAECAHATVVMGRCDDCGTYPHGHYGAPEPVPDFARRLDITRGYYAGIRDATPDVCGEERTPAYSCERAAGHGGPHYDGTREWSDAPESPAGTAACLGMTGSSRR